MEADEVYIGGRKPDKMGDTRTREIPIVSLVERGGKKRSFIVKRVTAQNIRALVKTHVADGAQLHTDQGPAYALMNHVMPHRSVNHGRKEYARRDPDGTTVSTNTVESSFALLRRGLVGTFHHVSANHLHRYIAEFDFRWNSRNDSDTERTQDALKKAKGKRLMYDSVRYRTKKQD